MIFAAHQPHYLPWIRYLHKVAAADVFVLLDDAQYTKNGWQNRNRVKGAEGPILLTVPVQAHLGDRILDVVPAGSRWVRRHLATLDTCYGETLCPWKKALQDVLEAHAEGPLSLLNEAVLRALAEAFGIRTPILRSSEIGVDGRASTRLAAIGRALGADTYLTGPHALEAYLDPRPFEAEGIGLAVQHWDCPRYPQRFPGAGFVPDLCALDLVVNRPHDALEILLSGGAVGGLEAATVGEGRER